MHYNTMTCMRMASQITSNLQSACTKSDHLNLKPQSIREGRKPKMICQTIKVHMIQPVGNPFQGQPTIMYCHGQCPMVLGENNSEDPMTSTLNMCISTFNFIVYFDDIISHVGHKISKVKLDICILFHKIQSQVANCSKVSSLN